MGKPAKAVAMVKEAMRPVFCAAIAMVLAACLPSNGARLYNATTRDLMVNVTFSDRGVWPVMMKPASFFHFGNELQVSAIEMREDGKRLFQLSDDTLPRVPAEIIIPYKQMWEIIEGGVCVLPEHDFHSGPYPKCADRSGPVIS